MHQPLDKETAALNAPSSRSWWDDAFTRLLLDAIPAHTRQLVEVGCGEARAAHSLLPSLPDASYHGLSASPELVNSARESFASTRFSKRVTVQLNPGPSLSLTDQSADVVLSLLSLQHEQHLEHALAEVRRVLRSHGRFVAVEPDNLNQRFYFDGVLEEINQVFHQLLLRARVARQPADIAIGPRLPSVLQASGFAAINFVIHAIHSSRIEDAKSYFTRIKRIVQGTAAEAGIASDAEEVEACEQAINRALFAGMPKRVGYSSHVVPVFRVIAGRGGPGMTGPIAPVAPAG